MPQVIEWVGAKEGDIVWKYPVEEITWGSQLVVKEFEAAVFLRDGKAYDVFRAGRHTLTTMNLPLLTRVLSRVAGYDKVPFRATVIFVSLKQFKGLFGVKAQTTELAPLMARGSFWYRVEDPNLFVNEVVGGQNAYDTDRVSEFLRGYLNERLIDELSRYSLAAVFTQLDETSFKTKNALIDPFRRIGLELIDLKFEGVDTTPEWRDRLFFIRSGVSASEVLRMQTVQRAAEELAKSQGAAVGAGVAIIPPLFQQPAYQPPPPPQPQPAVTFIACPSCMAQNMQGARFCQNCGQPLARNCPSCNQPVQPGSKFCPNCGTKLG
jgi:membrane protease subunit (stomatin/prohibitin family)